MAPKFFSRYYSEVLTDVSRLEFGKDQLCALSFRTRQIMRISEKKSWKVKEMELKKSGKVRGFLETLCRNTDILKISGKN